MMNKHIADRVCKECDELLHTIDNANFGLEVGTVQDAEFLLRLAELRNALLNAVSVGREIRRAPKE